MSLINDALKRANEAQKDGGARPPGVVLKPTEKAAPAPRRGLWLLGLLLLLLGVAAWYYWGRPTAPAATARATPAPAAHATNAVAAKPTNAVAGVQVNTNLIARTAQTIAAARQADSAGIADTVPGQAASPAGATNVATAAVPVSDGAPGGVTAASNAIAGVSGGVPAGEVVWPELKLQAIFFRPTRPSVRINGRVLERGQAVDGVKVAAIERNRVQVELRGQSKALDLP